MDDPIGRSIVLANVEETFALFTAHENGDGPHGMLWQKAGLLADRAGFCLVAPAVPSNVSPVHGAWHRPELVITPVSRSGHLCVDLLDDSVAWAQLLAGCHVDGPIELLPQVFSPGVEALIDALIDAGVRIDGDTLPKVSANTIASGV